VRRKRDRTLAIVRLDETADTPLHRQVYADLKRGILSGVLAPGALLPSTRTLASELGISRNTVSLAFDQLLAEGYIEGRVGSGTYVTTALGATLPGLAGLTANVGRRTSKGTPSRRGASVGERGELRPLGETRPFAIGLSPIDLFPAALWGRLLARRWKRAPRVLLAYGAPAGLPALREAIAIYLRSARAVRCTPEQVIILAGAQQALFLATRVLADSGDRVWCEDPGFPGARRVFESGRLRVSSMRVDAEGAVVPSSGRRGSPRFLYVTPSHQFPLGVTMSLARRVELLQAAVRAGAWILEDDYDSEYRYNARPLPSLQGLGAEDVVVYVGTFSKVLLPSLRLGYAVVPESLVDAFSAARSLIDRNSPGVDQAALADFLSDGHFERHIQRVRSACRERQEALIDAATTYLDGALHLEPSPAGLHLIGRLSGQASDVALAARAASHGLTVAPLSSFYATQPPRSGLVMGFGGFTPGALRTAVATLARVFDRRI
jgi:GntR family transcriptional regulator/MocR family aminotransferase